jgi:hypothetical protein
VCSSDLYDDEFDDGQLEAPVNMHVTKGGIYAIYNVYSLSEIKPDMVDIYRIVPFPTKIPQGKLLIRDDVITNIIQSRDFTHFYANISSHTATACASYAACHFHIPLTQAQEGTSCIEDFILGNPEINGKLCPFSVEFRGTEFFYQAIDVTYYSVLQRVDYEQSCRLRNGSEIIENNLWLENRGVLVIPTNCWVAIATDPIRLLFPSPSNTGTVTHIVPQTPVYYATLKKYVTVLNDEDSDGKNLKLGITILPDLSQDPNEIIDPWGGILQVGSPISVIFWLLLIAVPILSIFLIRKLTRRYKAQITQTNTHRAPTPVDLELRSFTSYEDSPGAARYHAS